MLQVLKALPRLPYTLLREHMSEQQLERTPEPDRVTSAEDFIAAWHEQGRDSTHHRFSAYCASMLVPEGGSVVDLGCGSGQILREIAELRPDVRVVGFDLSETFMQAGRSALAEGGLGARVELRYGDMTEVAALAPPQVDLVTAVLSLHHLLSADDLLKTLRGIAALRERTGCAVWLYDGARPRHPGTASVLTQLPPPFGWAVEAIRRESAASMLAAWTKEEMKAAVAEAGLPLHEATPATFFASITFARYEQILWARRTDDRDGVELTRARRPLDSIPDVKRWAAAFSGLPGEPGR